MDPTWQHLVESYIKFDVLCCTLEQLRVNIRRNDDIFFLLFFYHVLACGTRLSPPYLFSPFTRKHAPSSLWADFSSPATNRLCVLLFGLQNWPFPAGYPLTFWLPLNANSTHFFLFCS